MRMADWNVRLGLVKPVRRVALHAIALHRICVSLTVLEHGLTFLPLMPHRGKTYLSDLYSLSDLSLLMAVHDYM